MISEVLKETILIMKNQWKLLALTMGVHILLTFDPGLGEVNFGVILLLAIPFLLSVIYDYSLTAFIYENREKKDLSKSDFIHLFKLYRKIVPRVFFPLIGLLLISLIIIGLSSAIIYGIFAIFNIQNERSLYESGVADLNYVLIYSFSNLVTAFLVFQPVFYFVQKQHFFIAFISSIKFARKHLRFTLIVALLSTLFMFITTAIGYDRWYKNVLNGSILALEYFSFAACILVYFQKYIQQTEKTLPVLINKPKRKPKKQS